MMLPGQLADHWVGRASATGRHNQCATDNRRLDTAL